MVTRSTRPPDLALTIAPPASGVFSHESPRGRVIDFPAQRMAEHLDPLPGVSGTQRRAVIADPCRAESTALRIVRPARHGGPETVAKVGQHPPRAGAEAVCADGPWCLCPLSDHITDAERAVMDSICDQAARLATALSWVLGLVALVAVVMLVRWVG